MTTATQQAVAHLRFVRTAPRKLRRVADADALAEYYRMAGFARLIWHGLPGGVPFYLTATQ